MDDRTAQRTPKPPGTTRPPQTSTLRFQAHLLNAVGQAIIATDPAGIITYWNDAAEALYGWSAEEVLGKNVVEVTPAEPVREQAYAILERLRAGERWRGEFTVRRRDGNTFPVLVTDTPILNEQGALIGIVGVSTDLTEHKQGEAVLRESEERFRTLFQGLPVPTFVWQWQGDDFVMVDFNTAAERSTQNQISLHKGASLEAYLADRPDLIADIHRCFTNQETVTRETTHRFRTTGDVRDLVFSLAYVPPDLVMVHAQDVTERNRAEQTLRENEARYRFLAENVTDMVTRHTPDGTYTYVSPSVHDLFGYTPDEFIGQSSYDFHHPDDVARIRVNHRRVLDSKKPQRIDYRRRHKDGHYVWVESSVRSIRDPNTDAVTGIIAVTREITERKNAEQALRRSKERLNVLHEIERAILNTRSLEEVAEVALTHIRHHVPCGWAGLTVFDDDAQEAQIFAVHVDEESAFTEGQHLPLSEIPGLERLQQGLTESISDIAQVSSTSRLLRNLADEGGRSAICVPLMVADTLIGVLHLGSDTPGTFNDWEHIRMAQEVADSVALAFEHARLFEEVRAGHERLQHLTRQLVTLQENERRRLARELHDEIGQALTVVKMNLHALQSSDGAASSPHLDETIDTVEKLLEQVRTLSLDLRPSLLDDLGLVPAVRGLVHNVAQRAGMEAHVAAAPFERLSPELAITCFRVVQEALTNAARHAQARHVQVTLQRRDGQVHLTIRDDGTGFDVEAALERAAHGTSLGLLTMQERVRLLGGQITIEATPQQGTAIRVQLPLTTQPLTSPVEENEAL